MLAATHDHEVIHHNKTKDIPWRRVLDRRLKKPNISQMFALQWSLENLLAGTRKTIRHFKVYFQTDFEHLKPPSGRSIVTESEVLRWKVTLFLTIPRMIRARLRLEKLKGSTHFSLDAPKR